MIQNFDEAPDVLSPVEVSYLLRISIKTVYKLLRSKELEFKRIGSSYRISKSSVIDFLRRG